MHKAQWGHKVYPYSHWSFHRIGGLGFMLNLGRLAIWRF